MMSTKKRLAEATRYGLLTISDLVQLVVTRHAAAASGGSENSVLGGALAGGALAAVKHIADAILAGGDGARSPKEVLEAIDHARDALTEFLESNDQAANAALAAKFAR